MLPRAKKQKYNIKHFFSLILDQFFCHAQFPIIDLVVFQPCLRTSREWERVGTESGQLFLPVIDRFINGMVCLLIKHQQQLLLID